MSHGGPDGYVRLYDEEGNPIRVRLVAPSQYALTVSDKTAESILDQLKEHTALLRNIGLQIAAVTGQDAEKG